MTSFKIEIAAHIDDESAHLLDFIPGKLQRAFDGTKIVIDSVLVTKESEKNT
jgi:hypothetical protein